MSHIATQTSSTATCLLVFLFLASSSGVAAAADTQQAIDCPLRDVPYSIDSPLIDVLLKPEAKAVIDREMPALLQKIPPMLANTSPPSFGAIISVRALASFTRTSQDALATINSALLTLTISDADRAARCARYDVNSPHIKIPRGKPRLLMF